MKTKEELNALKEEVEILNNKLVKLNDEKLKQVSGGYLESFVRISNGEFPYIRFGKGNKNLVIIAGMSLTGLTELGEPVSEMYRDFIEEYTVYVFDMLQVLPDNYSVRNMVQDTAEVMQKLEINKADVIDAS